MGAGKSTLFQTISGAVEATEGQVILNGQDLSHMPEYNVHVLLVDCFKTH